MSYFIGITEPEEANEELEDSYNKLLSMFHTLPKVFMAQSIRPDLLSPLIVYVDRLMFETHALPRRTKELIAAYISKLNACAYWVDAHSAMVMAEGFTKEQVKSILEDVDCSDLIDEKTKMLLQLSKKINHESSKIHKGTIQILRDNGCTEEEIFETIAVTALFNFMDRMADALGTPVEGFQDMMKQMKDK